VRALGAVLREMALPAPYAQSRPLRVEELELSEPGPQELLVRMLAAGLCHSDLSVIDGSRPRVMPMVLGHEAVAEVVTVGPDTQGFSPGDRVALAFVPSCGSCPACACGRPALCQPGAAANAAGTLLSGRRHWQAPLNHHLGVSAFAEMAVVSARSAVKIDAELDPAIAALFGCAVLTGVGAVVNTARVSPGQSVAVFGLGGVGLASLLGGQASGAYPLVAVDVIDDKLELARKLGATHCFNGRREDPVQAIKAVTRGGVDFCFETAGNETALVQAYGATRSGGTTVTAGLPHPSKMFSVPAVSLVAEERTVKGCYLGSSVPSRDIPRYLDLYRAGRLPVEALLTHRLRLDEINEGFDRLARGEAVRQVVVF
jgi:Zn-dependent alcohol dehydrogenase